MKIRNFICAALLISTGLTSTESVLAGKDDDTLRVALPREMDTLDIYTNTTREGVIMSRMVWDGLLFRDPVTQEYKGNLATKWFWENDTTLIVELHKGIKYHNGEPFDADDVVFTLNWVADPANGAKPRRNVGWIKSAEKLENHKVRINLNKPFPAALEYLSGPVVIYPNEYFSKLVT